MNKNIIKIIAVAFLFLTFAFSHSADAATADNVYGQAWSANTGYINFNNCSDPLNAGTCSGTSYGVSIGPGPNYFVTGQAWSNNIGWVNFSGLSSCPTLPCTATYNPVSEAISGWARACSGTQSGNCSSMTSRTDGWDGWISLSSTTGVTYAANLNKITGFGSGQAWGSDIVGWIDFSGVRLTPAINAVCAAPPHGSAYYTAPTPTCNPGIPSAISGTGPWTWTCNSTNGGTNASCSASKKIDGVCQIPPHNNSYSTAPTPACSAGTPTGISGNGPWTWSCNGVNGGTNASCSASLAGNPIVTTNSGVTSITQTSACLPGGNLNINGSTNVPIDRKVEYSPNSNMSGNGTLNAGTTSTSGNYTPFSCTISGLTPNTTYYYRAAVIDSASTKFTGSILSFTTLSSTPAPTVDIKFSGADSATINSGAAGSISWTSANMAVNNITSCTLSSSAGSYSWEGSGKGITHSGIASGPINATVTITVTCSTTTPVAVSATDSVVVTVNASSVTLTPWCSGSQGVLTLNTSGLSTGTSCPTGNAPWTSVPASPESKNVSAGTYNLTCGGASSGSVVVPACPGGASCPTCPPPPKKPRWWEF